MHRLPTIPQLTLGVIHITSLRDNFEGEITMETAETTTLTPDAASMIETLQAKKSEIAGRYGDRPAILPALRKRLRGSGIKRYGFILKTLKMSASNMRFAPGSFDRDALEKLVRDIGNLRGILSAARQLVGEVEDRLLHAGDDAFRMSLFYYNPVRDLARLGDPGAREVFDTLRPFFARGPRVRADGEAPTQKQVIRDVKAILRGTKDGEVFVKGKHGAVMPKEIEVVDETGKPRGGVEVMERG